MTKRYFSYFSFVLIVLFSGCTDSVSKKSTSERSISTNQFQKIKVEAFAAKIQALPNEQLVDVRTPQEFKAGAIQDAVNLNFYDKDFKQQLDKLDKSKPVMVYCKSGGRSGKTLDMLKGMGFTEAYDLIGGYTQWSAVR